MVFQEGALFDSLTVRENVGYKLWEELHWPDDQVNKRVEEILGFIGLAEHVDKMPSELSGGQRRRVAIARAMAAKPRVLLYDEPTTGLDPITATTVDEEIVKLRDLEGRELDRRHAPAARRVLHRRPHGGAKRRRRDRGRRRREVAKRPNSSCCATASSSFEGPAGDLKRVDGSVPEDVSVVGLESRDHSPYAPHTFARMVRTEDRTPDARRHRIAAAVWCSC